MNTITPSNPLDKAQAILASLIESCCDLDSVEIKTNLAIVNGFLCDAIEAAESRNIKNLLAFRIQIARENLGMSEDDLAEKLDIHPGDVLTWEDGTDQPLAGMIIPLANALKCDPMWLLTGESSNHQYPATPVHQSRNQYSGQQRSDASDHASHHVKHQSQA
ncbi:helix-turn-helix domain-containing protein [Salmonella enterica]|nr:helix-turn-helix domain-containing protein [Salmonella enterica]EJK5559240.1 helix-turn-helix domain-containing protein [Salmonella enterica]